MKITLPVLFALMPLIAVAQEKLLYVGTYTEKGSEGIYVYRFNTQTGALTQASMTTGIKNPSFLALSPNKKNLYAVAENDPGAVHSYRVNSTTGKLTQINIRPASGIWPCHLAVDKTGKYCIVGNYGSGNVSVLPIKLDGSLGEPGQAIQHEGKSANAERQEKPHVHSINISANNKHVVVADLGTDKLMHYTFDASKGQLSPADTAYTSVTPGAGPRHFAYHPNGRFAYAVLELNCTIGAFTYKKGALSPIQTISTLPSDFTGKNTCADIHISADGKFLYASNRGHHSIVIYKIDKKSGKLTLVGHQSVLGSTPRNFTIDPTGNFLLVANQDSNNIQVFRRDKKTGKLTHVAEGAKVSMPVCLLFE
ncbi:MAG: lactonase family protein [Saprospiraceae bacterium]|nr:lactonase family protein [Saprospiraceae bacterium]